MESLLLLLLSDEHGLLRGLLRQLYAVHVWRTHYVMSHDWCVGDSGPRRASVAHSWGGRDVACHGCCLLNARSSVRHLWGTMPARCLLTAALAGLLCHSSRNARVRVLKSRPWTDRAPCTLIGRGDAHRHTLTSMIDPDLAN